MPNYLVDIHNVAYVLAGHLQLPMLVYQTECLKDMGDGTVRMPKMATSRICSKSACLCYRNLVCNSVNCGMECTCREGFR